MRCNANLRTAKRGLRLLRDCSTLACGMFPPHPRGAVDRVILRMSLGERYARHPRLGENSRAPTFAAPPKFQRAGVAGALVCGRFREGVHGTAGEENRDRAIRHLESRGRSGFFRCLDPDRWRRVVSGSIEFDLADQNWEAHSHATNPAFDDTVLHVFVTAGHARLLQSDERESQCARRCRSIPRPCRRLRRAIFHWRDRAVVMRRCAICRRKKCSAFSTPRRNSACTRKNASVAAADGTPWPRRSAFPGTGRNVSATSKTNCPSLCSRSACRCRCCALRLTTSRPYFSASPGFSKRRTWRGSARRRASYLRGLWDKWWPRRAELERLVLPSRTWRLELALDHSIIRSDGLPHSRTWPHWPQVSGVR